MTFIIFMLTLGLTASAIRVEQGVIKEHYDVNRTVSMTCYFYDLDPLSTIRWQRITTNSSSHEPNATITTAYPIATNDVIQSAYATLPGRRYTVTFSSMGTPDSRQYDYLVTLTIREAQLEDTGTIQCLVLGTDYEKRFKLVVTEPLEVHLYMKPFEFAYPPEAHNFSITPYQWGNELVCLVRSYHQPAKVTLYLDDRKLDGIQEQMTHITHSSSSLATGLSMVQYEVLASVDVAAMDAHNTAMHTVQCTAKIEEPVRQKYTDTIVRYPTDRPVLDLVSRTHTSVAPGEAVFLSCSVYGLDYAEDQLVWQHRRNRTYVNIHPQHNNWSDKYSSYVTMLDPKKVFTEHTLHIRDVYNHDAGTYRCHLSSLNIYQQAYITIHPKHVTWYVNYNTPAQRNVTDDVIVINPGTVDTLPLPSYTVTCVVEGGLPAPRLDVVMNKERVTGYFNPVRLQVRSNNGSAVEQLNSGDISVYLLGTPHIHQIMKSDSQRFVCRANSGALVMTSAVTVRVEGNPAIHCTHSIYYHNSYRFLCNVTSVSGIRHVEWRCFHGNKVYVVYSTASRKLDVATGIYTQSFHNVTDTIHSHHILSIPAKRSKLFSSCDVTVQNARNATLHKMKLRHGVHSTKSGSMHIITEASGGVCLSLDTAATTGVVLLLVLLLMPCA